jgi:hypothetical protein
VYLNLHLDVILAVFVGLAVGYVGGRVHAWSRRKG